MYVCHWIVEYACSFSDLELKPTGVLEVKLVEARDLKNKDLVGKSDPFAVLYIRPLREKTKKSKTIVSVFSCLR
jgi:Ca2+-dependent lipid-binding protein